MMRGSVCLLLLTFWNANFAWSNKSPVSSGSPCKGSPRFVPSGIPLRSDSSAEVFLFRRVRVAFLSSNLLVVGNCWWRKGDGLFLRWLFVLLLFVLLLFMLLLSYLCCHCLFHCCYSCEMVFLFTYCCFCRVRDNQLRAKVLPLQLRWLVL